jgi:hypothetical protein
MSARVPLLLLLLLPACVAQSFTYENYFNSTLGTSLVQAQAAATAALNGLTLRVALLSIVQNITYFPDNITYGDGASPPPNTHKGFQLCVAPSTARRADMRAAPPQTALLCSCKQ